MNVIRNSYPAFVRQGRAPWHLLNKRLGMLSRISFFHRADSEPGALATYDWTDARSRSLTLPAQIQQSSFQERDLDNRSSGTSKWNWHSRPAICSVAGATAFIFFSATLSAASVELKLSQTQIEVTVDGKPFTTYYYNAGTAKPYLMPLRTASGVIVTRGFPVLNDVSMGDPHAPSFEPHQRPLYFGHGDFDGLDFWQEQVFDKYYHDHGHQAYGHMVLKNVEVPGEGNDAGNTIRARYTLNTPNNRVIGEESQSFTFSGDDKTRIIDCEFVLYATNGPLDIGDTKEGTFGIRLAAELSGSHAHMLNSKGAEGEKAIWGKPADWVDYSGTISGKKVDIAVFDSPKSFRHPTTWHARAYGLFAANPFGLREFTRDPNKDGSWTIPEGKSLTFRYRVLIGEGGLSADQINEAYRQYASQQ